jgi:hypothetical protein
MVKNEFSDFGGRPLEWFRARSWTRQAWVPRPALRGKGRAGGGLELFLGQEFDPNRYELIQDAWSHDHCPLCGEEISDLPHAPYHDGYVHGGEWICPTCYERWVGSGAPPAA